MRKSKFGALLASTAMIGIPMSPAERAAGRYMRAPDEHQPAPTPAPAASVAQEPEPNETDDFAAFEAKVAAGDDGTEAQQPAAETGEEGEDGDDDGEQGEEGKDEQQPGEEGKPPKKAPQSAKDRIRDLNARLRASEAARETDRRGFEARLERIEKGLPAEEKADTTAAEAVAPDPSDLEKYPLGALDDRYIEDKLEFLAEQKAEAKLGSLLQREQQKDQQAESERIATALQEQAETMASKGAELYDDYHETVVEAAMAGDFDLTQDTFEALAEAEFGPQILYDLATDPAEATRVAQLSPFQRLKFVLDKNAEYEGKKPPPARKIPGAETPPAPPVRGSGASKMISADTTDFASFERMANAKK